MEDTWLKLYMKEARKSRVLEELLYTALDKGVDFIHDHERKMTWDEQRTWVESKLSEIEDRI